MLRPISLFLLLFIAFPLWTQGGAVSSDEQLGYVGMKLAELIERFGTPSLVLTSRGNEVWQDDVVFRYAEGDFYIYKDRVWQVKLSKVCGVSVGDPKAAVLLVLGENAEDRGDHVFIPIEGGDWNLMLRVNFNGNAGSSAAGSGQAAAIYVYRPDF